MNNQFLQSLEWEKFQKSLNRKTWRIEDVLIIKHDLFFNKSYLYCPRCSNKISNTFLDQVKQIAKQENSIFLKIEPEDNFQFSIFNFQKSTKQIQPGKTVILNITKSEDELLNQMHNKTRYNIKLAEKKGIEIKESDNIDSFLKLLKETAKRDGFHLHLEEYYKKMLEENLVKLFVAKHKNKVVAANLVCFFDKTAIYLHGASDYNHRQLMAPYLLQWKIILKAKELGLKKYDFWGIDEDKWPGVTRFKKGFNGKEISYPGAYDLVYSKIWYWLYKIGRKIL